MTRLHPWAAKDIPTISAIMAEHPLWQHYGVTKEEASRRLEQLMREGEPGFVATLADTQTVQGFVLYNRKTFGEAGYIRLFGVAPNVTSHGLGAQLLKHVEGRLVHEETYRLLLLCTEWNHRAQHFYERHGFAAVGRLPDWVQVGTTEVLFAKHLARPVTSC